jgi:hypothetical protein
MQRKQKRNREILKEHYREKIVKKKNKKWRKRIYT